MSNHPNFNGVEQSMATGSLQGNSHPKQGLLAQLVHVGVPRDPGYQPHVHKGALKQVSPEEITAAYILAIARDVEKQEGEEIMDDVVIDSDMEMYWYAVEQREALEQSYKVAKA